MILKKLMMLIEMMIAIINPLQRTVRVPVNAVRKGMVALFLFSAMLMNAQFTSNSFFLESNPMRHKFNPAIQPEGIAYLALPYIGDFNFDTGNDAYSISDILPVNRFNAASLFLSSLNSKQNFYDQLNLKDLSFNGDFELNYFDLGFRAGKGFFNLALKKRIQGSGVLSNDLLRFTLIGNGFDPEKFDFASTDFQLADFYETTLGYSFSTKLVDFGAKLKFLNGNNSILYRTDFFNLSTSIDAWEMEGHGAYRSTFPKGSIKVEQINDTTKRINMTSGTYFQPMGLGAAVDLGVVIHPNDNLEIGIAALDLGGISWYRHINDVNFDVNYTFTGVQDINLLYDNITKQVRASVDQTESDLNGLVKYTKSTIPYTSTLVPRMNVSVLTHLLDHKVSAGAMLENRWVNGVGKTKATLALTGRPRKNLEFAMSYSMGDNNLNLLGMGVNYLYRNINLTLSTDYFWPEKYVSYNFVPDKTYPFTVVMLPYETNRLNLHAGISIVIPEKEDARICNCYTLEEKR